MFIFKARRNGKEESAFVLDVDRQMCFLRFPNLKAGPAGKTGRDCVVINCTEHEHLDEWIYRGNSDRFPNLQSSVAVFFFCLKKYLIFSRLIKLQNHVDLDAIDRVLNVHYLNMTEIYKTQRRILILIH